MKSLPLLLLAVLSALPVRAVEKAPLTLGAYAHPKDFWDTGARLDDYGVNAVFIRSLEFNEETVRRAKAEGCKVYAEFATLNGKYGGYVDKHPDAHPIDDSGQPARPATWFMGVCPTHEGFRKFRMDALRELLTKYELDGIWLDYTHWHAQFEDPYPVFIKTCFSDSCLAAFEKWAGLKVEGRDAAAKARWIFDHAAKKWEDWRVHVIVDWAREIRAITKEIRPHALVGIYHTAWKDEDLSGVRRRALGLDFEALAPHIDIFSPMIYHGRSGKSPAYVQEFVEYFSAKPYIKSAPGEYPQIWPIVQSYDDPRVTPEVFEQVLTGGLSGKSTGVMMYTIDSVAKDAAKMEVMKRIYKGRAGK